MIRRIAFALIALAAPLAAQSPRQLPRGTSITGMNDSAIVLASDSALRTRALSLHELFKRPCGTAAKPSYTFANDSSKGMYCSGGDSILWSNAGSTAFSISGSATRTLVGPNGNFIIRAGTGASRTLSLQTTTSGSAVKNTLVLGADSSATVLGNAFSKTAIVTNSLINNAANQAVFDDTTISGSRVARILSFGSTTLNGRIQLASRRSDGTNPLTAVDIDSTGKTTFNATALLSNGTAAAPSLALANSPTTGVYRFGADTLGFAIGGAHSLRLSGGASATLVGGAGNMTIQAGTGNNRALILNTTDGTGTAQNSLVLGSSGNVALLANKLLRTDSIGAAGSGQRVTIGNAVTDTLAILSALIRGGAGNMTLLAGTGNNRTFTLQATNGSGTATTAITAKFDTVRIHDELVLPSLTAASGTPNTLCMVSGSKQVTENAATSCVVSSRRFKTDIKPLALDSAYAVVRRLTPVTFRMKDGGRLSLHVIAEQADSINQRLSFRDRGLVNSVDDGAILSAVLRVVQEQDRLIRSQQAAIDSLRKALVSTNAAVAAILKP